MWKGLPCPGLGAWGFPRRAPWAQVAGERAPSLQGAWCGHSTAPGWLCDFGQSPVISGLGWGQEGGASWATEKGGRALPGGFRPSVPLADLPRTGHCAGRQRGDGGVREGACFFGRRHGSRPCLWELRPRLSLSFPLCKRGESKLH